VSTFSFSDFYLLKQVNSYCGDLNPHKSVVRSQLASYFYCTKLLLAILAL